MSLTHRQLIIIDNEGIQTQTYDNQAELLAIVTEFIEMPKHICAWMRGSSFLPRSEQELQDHGIQFSPGMKPFDIFSDGVMDIYIEVILINDGPVEVGIAINQDKVARISVTNSETGAEFHLGLCPRTSKLLSVALDAYLERVDYQGGGEIQISVAS